MTVVAVLTQSLRLPQASNYLWELPASTRKVILTENPKLVGQEDLPPGCEVRASGSAPGPGPAARALSSNAVERAKRWTRSGSQLGLKVDRWLRAADWRLRYVDRVFAVVESRRRGRSMIHNDLVVEQLRTLATEGGVEEVVVFDLFDLPAVMLVAGEEHFAVSVR